MTNQTAFTTIELRSVVRSDVLDGIAGEWEDEVDIIQIASLEEVPEESEDQIRHAVYGTLADGTTELVSTYGTPGRARSMAKRIAAGRPIHDRLVKI